MTQSLTIIPAFAHYKGGRSAHFRYQLPVYYTMPSLRLGSIAPDFEAETTAGPIKFHEWIGDSWVSSFVDE